MNTFQNSIYIPTASSWNGLDGRCDVSLCRWRYRWRIHPGAGFPNPLEESKQPGLHRRCQTSVLTTKIVKPFRGKQIFIVC